MFKLLINKYYLFMHNYNNKLATDKRYAFEVRYRFKLVANRYASNINY